MTARHLAHILCLVLLLVPALAQPAPKRTQPACPPAQAPASCHTIGHGIRVCCRTLPSGRIVCCYRYPNGTVYCPHAPEETP